MRMNCLVVPEALLGRRTVGLLGQAGSLQIRVRAVSTEVGRTGHMLGEFGGDVRGGKAVTVKIVILGCTRQRTRMGVGPDGNGAIGNIPMFLPAA